ncbi:unnamed protein product [Effrenium voratum]|nr:unnamed protein product [Effrenium voratum]
MQTNLPSGVQALRLQQFGWKPAWAKPERTVQLEVEDEEAWPEAILCRLARQLVSSCQIPFARILEQISKANAKRSGCAPKVLPDVSAWDTDSMESDEPALLSKQHDGGMAAPKAKPHIAPPRPVGEWPWSIWSQVCRPFTPDTVVGTLKPRQLNHWEEARIFSPNRTWPAGPKRGAQPEFYDARQGLPWQPVSWKHSGERGAQRRSAPPNAGALEQSSANLRRLLNFRDGCLPTDLAFAIGLLHLITPQRVRSPACAMAVRTDLTPGHYRGFVRQDEEWPEDSEQYRAGCEIQNRKRPPPDEVPGDVFDRQRVIPGFDQALIERQVCLVLGAGGVGQNVALTLARLGVAKIILVDRDTYAASNLTRQCLGSLADVGRRKVDVAKDGLQAHNLRSEIVAVHIDAVLEWASVVNLARQSTVVFNAIDVGVMWDFCVNSLCKEFGIPLSAGQSFGWKFMTELYTGRPGEVCAFCYDSVTSTFAADERAVTRPGGLLERFRTFTSADASAQEIVAFLVQDRQFRCSGPQLAKHVEASLRHCQRQALGDAAAWVEFLRALKEETVRRLLPGRVSSLADLQFIPRSQHAETRYIGSWVCPCLSCAVTMVSQWAGLLVAPPGNEDVAQEVLPQSVTFNLDLGMTSEEQLGYEMGSMGMTLDKAERRFCRDACSGSCGVCAAAAQLAAEESLFVGRLPVVLCPWPGQVQDLPERWSVDSDSSAEVRLRQQPMASLGVEYANAVLPGMPATDWQSEGSRDVWWPPELKDMPMLKVPLSSSRAKAPSALRGVTSGIRSALVKVRGKWFRLKGCGNRDEGFPVEKVGNSGEESVRGCCFKHTTQTELCMTDMVDKVLSEAGLDCANKPLGSYLYQAEPAWMLPKMTRHCVVFETLGNARLGDHLIGGLLQLLPLVSDLCEQLEQCILQGRGSDEVLETSDLVCCGMATADVLGQLKQKGLRLPEHAPAAAKEVVQVPEALHQVWEAARQRMQQWHYDESEPSVILWLAWRLGWECGATLKALHSADIAWGTYPDSMGIHCNAHLNNLVIKPPHIGRKYTFLAALDFDMAFSRQNFLPDAVPGGGLGLETFDGILAFEASMGLKTVLSGSDFSNTGVQNVKAAASHRLLETAIRDTMVTAYSLAFEGGADLHAPREDMRAAAYDIITLALCLTTDVEG